MRHHTKSAPRALNAPASHSAHNSPMSSRNTSPTRHSQRSPALIDTHPRSQRPSRKSSSEASPNRTPNAPASSNTVPSAAAIQRALSSSNIPQLPPTSSTQDSSRVPRPSKPASTSNSGDNTPHWPVSPRLKSPPPPSADARSRSRQNSLRTPLQHKKPDAAATPSIVVQNSSPGPAYRVPARDDVASDPEEAHLSMKPTGRGGSGVAPKLETVQESSLPTTPGEDSLDTRR